MNLMQNEGKSCESLAYTEISPKGGGHWGVPKTAIPRKKWAKTAIPHQKSTEYRNRSWTRQVIVDHKLDNLGILQNQPRSQGLSSPWRAEREENLGTGLLLLAGASLILG